MLSEVVASLPINENTSVDISGAWHLLGFGPVKVTTNQESVTFDRIRNAKAFRDAIKREQLSSRNAASGHMAGTENRKLSTKLALVPSLPWEGLDSILRGIPSSRKRSGDHVDRGDILLSIRAQFGPGKWRNFDIRSPVSGLVIANRFDPYSVKSKRGGNDCWIAILMQENQPRPLPISDIFEGYLEFFLRVLRHARKYARISKFEDEGPRWRIHPDFSGDKTDVEKFVRTSIERFLDKNVLEIDIIEQPYEVCRRLYGDKNEHVSIFVDELREHHPELAGALSHLDFSDTQNAKPSTVESATKQPGIETPSLQATGSQNRGAENDEGGDRSSRRASEYRVDGHVQEWGQAQEEALKKFHLQRHYSQDELDNRFFELWGDAPKELRASLRTHYDTLLPFAR